MINIFAFLIFVLVGNLAVAAEGTILFQSWTEDPPKNILVIAVTELGKLTPSVSDRYEKDPFGRAENDKYKYTYVRCRHNFQFRSYPAGKVAFRDPFSTIIGLTFISENNEITMQGNYGMSAGTRAMEESAVVEFESLIGRRFSSRELANEAVASGLCDLLSATKVEPAGIVGEMMSDTATEWSEVSRSLLVTVVETAAAKKRREEREASDTQSPAELQPGFLVNNAKRPGIIQTSTGLQYEVLRRGFGDTPNINDKVEIHYHGELVDGSVFDSSYDRGQPVTGKVSQFILGWTEALQLMTEGGKYKLYVPSDLAFGEQGAGGGAVPPHAILITELELIKVIPQ